MLSTKINGVNEKQELIERCLFIKELFHVSVVKSRNLCDGTRVNEYWGLISNRLINLLAQRRHMRWQVCLTIIQICTSKVLFQKLKMREVSEEGIYFTHFPLKRLPTSTFCNSLFYGQIQQFLSFTESPIRQSQESNANYQTNTRASYLNLKAWHA